MEQIDGYLQTITRAYPELVIGAAVLHTDGGQFNNIVTVNDELIFRFPRAAHVAGAYPAQINLLAYLQDKLPLPIPVPSYYQPDDVPWPQRFFGYRRIAGMPLYRSALATIRDQAAVTVMAQQIGSFLKSLHRLPIPSLVDTQTIADTLNYWQTLYVNVQTSLFPHMRTDARRQVTKHFQQYLQQPARLTFTAALRHGDFGGSNILYDPTTNRITGVIDFESLGLGDPATDAAALSTLGNNFFRLCLAAYPEMEIMRDRVQFYRGTFALQEALAGLRDGDQVAFRRGIAAYE